MSGAFALTAAVEAPTALGGSASAVRFASVCDARAADDAESVVTPLFAARDDVSVVTMDAEVAARAAESELDAAFAAAVSVAASKMTLGKYSGGRVDAMVLKVCTAPDTVASDAPGAMEGRVVGGGVGDAEGLPDAVILGVAVTPAAGVTDALAPGEMDAVGVVVALAVPLADAPSVLDALAPTVRLAVGVPLTDDDALAVVEGVGDGLAVGVALGVALGVGVAVTLPERELLPVFEGLAPEERLAI